LKFFIKKNSFKLADQSLIKTNLYNPFTMNKFIIITTFIISILLIGCQSEQASEVKPTTTTASTPTAPLSKKRAQITVSGTITNAGNKNIKLSHKTTNRSSIIKDDKFRINLLIDEPGIFNLVYNGQKIPLFLRPNDEAIVDFDAQKMAKTIKFGGTDPKAQEYLFQKKINDPLTYTQKRNSAKLSEKDFIKQTNETRATELALFNKFKKENKDLTSDFLLFEETEIQYNWAKQFSDYSLYHAFYNKQEAYTPSPELMAFTKELDLNNDQLMISEAYRNYLVAQVGQKASNLVQTDLMNGGKIQTSLRAFEVVEKDHSAPMVKSFLLYTFFNQHLRSKGINGSEDLYQRFKKQVTNPRYLADIDEAFLAWKHLKKGLPAPNFSYPDQQGKNVGLADLKGKVVYIDVWATWCGPCKVEIPHLEKLQEKFHDQPVAFVSVSIDKNATAWAKMVKENNMSGIQILADKAGSSQICQDYKIKGIPRFILIDQQGNIVNAQADRPSQGTVAGEIEALL
jgi:thiol-disulfide isomerase/thioredoxin